MRHFIHTLFYGLLLFQAISISHASPLILSPEEQTWIKNHKTIRISGPQSFPPFQYNDTDGTFKGMASDYVFQIAKMAGLDVEVITNIPWAEILKKTENKGVDLLTCVAKTSDRERYLSFTKPYLSYPLVIITRKEAAFVGGTRDLINKKISFVKNNAAYDWLKQDRISVTPLFVDSSIDALKAVSMGNADAAIENLAAATYLIGKYGLTNLKVAAPTSYENYELHIGVRKDAPELLTIFNKGISAIDPEAQNKIHQKWIAVRYEHGIAVSDVVLWVLIVLGMALIPIALFFFANKKLKREIQTRIEAESEKERLIKDLTTLYSNLERSEQELRVSEEKYRILFSNRQTAIYIFDRRDLRFVDVNEAFVELYGYSREELLSVMKVTDISVEPEETLKALEYAIQTGSVFVPLRWHRKKEGTVFPVEIAGGNYAWTGKPVMYCMARDIAERRRMEDRVRRLETFEVMGRIAGGVAHDLNNILGVSVGYSHLLMDERGLPSHVQESLLRIKESGMQAAEIVQDLLTMTRKGAVVRRTMNLNGTVRGYLGGGERAGLEAKHPGIALRSSLDPQLMNISGSEIHLYKLVMNLLVNAVEATANDQKINITTENVYLEAPIQGYELIPKGEYAAMTVSDQGQGISPKDMPHIFEPFYATKHLKMSGSGLGLAVVLGVVKDHGGFIDVQSEQGKGSTFRLFFPVTREGMAEPEAGQIPPACLGHGEKILVVDDEEWQCEVAEMMLGQLGYEVTAVTSGEEAVAYLKGGRADLIVLDMRMEPGMDGLDTYREAISLHPGQKAIIVSGFAESDRSREAQRLGAGAFVRKPYLLERLGMEIRKALEPEKGFIQ